MSTLRGFGLAIGLMLLSAGAVAADRGTRELSFDIPAQELREALNAFGRQAALSVAFYDDAVADLRTRGLTGNFEPKEALTRLLADTSLQFRFVNANTVAIQTAAPAQKSNAAARDGIALPPVQVAQSDDENSGDPADTAARPDDRTPATRGSVGAPFNVQEIVVTAQKRQERLQDVPISISVLTGETLDRSSVEGVTEALNRVPGVSTVASGQAGGTALTVRGVTAPNGLFGGSTAVGYYLDSVPLGLVRSALVPDASAYDLQRVEVLRGPHGTLYGASSLNGTVRVLSADADPEQFEFKARTSLSTTENGGENYRGDMMVNVPLVQERLAARATVGYVDNSGWIDRPNAGVEDANDSELLSTRLKLNAQPTDDLSIGFLAWLSRGDYGAAPKGPANGIHLSLVEEPQTIDYDVYGLKIDYAFGAFSLSSMTSYIDLAQAGYSDLNTLFGTPPQPIRGLTDLDSRVFAQELVLNSSSEGPWRWSLGAMYRDAQDDNYQFRINRIAPIDWTDSSESVAVFGELTRLFNDGLFALTAGLRYFEDEVGMQENVKQDASANPLLVRTSKFDAVTPRVVLAMHPSEQLTFYASYSEGFRSGFDQTPLALAAASDFGPVKEDLLRNYELGAKGSFWDGRVAFDSAVFYTDWQDTQQLLVLEYLGAFIAAVTNAESVSGLGAEFSLTALAAPGLELGLNAGWNDLTFDSDLISFNRVLFRAGERISYSPEYTVGASADYLFALGGGYEARLSVGGNYISEQTNRSLVPAAGGSVINTGDAMFISRASISVASPNRWTASLYGDNLNDEDGAISAAPVGSLDSLRTRPRTVGVQLEYHF